MVTMTPNIGSLRKDFSAGPQQQQQQYHQQQQLLQHNNSPMKPKKRVSDSTKKPKKRRSSSASDKENDTIATPPQQQHQQQQPTSTSSQQQQPVDTWNSTTTTQATTNGYTNGHRSPDSTHQPPRETNSQATGSPSIPSTSSASSFTAPTTLLPTEPSPPAKPYDPASMDFELDSAVELMTRFISKTPLGKSNMLHLGQFNALLVAELRQYYTGHWYPERPMRGSGHRCLRVNQSGNTSIIEKTANSSGNSWVLDCLPKEFTIWIDPGEVSYRIGEDGSICVHFSRPITRPTNTSKQG